ncbi:MAG: hypothetical protein IT232_10620 [Flavobacteriales bacterium]|nr:hypothetical protein [Flavobacteriales bacterium]
MVDDWTYDDINIDAEPFVEVGYESISTWLTRGYTGHEHLTQFGLINMNGRLYDPILGRMLSPDNYVQDATSTQGFNRYSYVVNNPLKYNDPSGESWEDVVRGIINTIGFLSGGTLFSESVTYLNDKINGIQRDSYFDMDYLLGRAAPSSMNSGSGTQSMGDYSGSLNDKSNSWAEQEEYAIESYIWGYWWSQARVDGKDFGEPKRNEPIYKTRLVKIENNNPTIDKGGFIDNKGDFIGFMTDQAKNNPVEVAAFGLTDGRFFVQPWKGNRADRSNNDFNHPSLEGLTISSQYHTHPNGSGLSHKDAVFSQTYRVPVHSISPNGDIWRYNHADYRKYPIDYFIPLKAFDWIPFGTKIN